MSVKIRLSRGGAKKDPHYSVIVVDSKVRRDGRHIEKVGHYHPRLASDNPQRLTLQAERCAHWISVGAIPTEAVVKLMKKLELPVPEKYEIVIRNNKNHGISRKDVAAQLKAEAAAEAAAKKEKAAAKAAAEKLAAEEAKAAAKAAAEQEA